MKQLDSIRRHKKKIDAIAKKYGVYDVRVFGSVVQGKPDPRDIDLLVNIERNRSLFDLVGFKQEVDSLFKREVDVVLENSLHWYIKDKILDEAEPL